MSHLNFEIDGQVAYLTMNRPEARNALSLEMRTEIRDRLQEAELNNDIRCIVLRGAGEHFLAAAHIYKSYSWSQCHHVCHAAVEQAGDRQYTRCSGWCRSQSRIVL